RRRRRGGNKPQPLGRTSVLDILSPPPSLQHPRGGGEKEGEASDRILHTKLLADNPLNKFCTQNCPSTIR
ncbi:hypothetical protein, partial [Hoylesella saccharolytica]|uniref:hypothetical protein n=1 Tax=Hoylesella saccharolytica TaxID=633701 RepID=UPI001F363486